MISKDQAHNAISYLDTLGMEALTHMHGEEYEYNVKMLNGAFQVLRAFVNEQIEQKPIKIVYEYKLRRADGKYLNRSWWDEKGKTYKNRAALMVALGSHVGTQIDNHPDRPTFDKFTSITTENGIVTKRYDQEGYKKAYQEWWTKRDDKNLRAEYIPEDWIVIAIAVNTSKPLQEMSAREWYKGTAKESA